MQSDHQNNYWKKDSTEPNPNEITEMYTPEPDSDVNNNSSKNDNIQKPIANNEPIHWTAAEYIDNEKNALWFVGFSIVILCLISIDIFFLKSYTFSALVIVMALAVIVFSRRPARLIEYTLSGNQGLYIGEKLYHFSEFKSFGIVSDRNQHSIILIPTKRFSPSISVYFPDKSGEAIVDIFGARLPMENLKLDAVDVIIRKLRL